MAGLRSSLLVGLVAVVGCADTGGQTLIVLRNTVPGAECTVDPAVGGPFLPSGRIDATGVVSGDSNLGYVVTPTIENVADSQDGDLAAQRIVIMQGARVDLTIGLRADGTELLSAGELDALNNVNALKFTSPFSGAIEPDGGLAAVIFELVPAAVIEAIGNKLVGDEVVLVTASFQVFGRTVGGTGVEADPFSYPITVCNGCLFRNLGDCSALPDGDYPTGSECNFFQDAPSSCCTSGSGFLVCPAAPEMAGT